MATKVTVRGNLNQALEEELLKKKELKTHEKEIVLIEVKIIKNSI